MPETAYRLALMALVGGMAACAPIEERFMKTASVCAEELNDTCSAHLREDFGAPDDTPQWWMEGTHRFVQHCVALTALPRSSDDVHPVVVDWLWAAPGESTGALLYNRVSDLVVETDFGDPGNASAEYDPDTGRVLWDESARPTWWVESILVHEAGHAMPGSGHIDCPKGDRQGCDADWHGTLGKQIAFASLAAAISDDPEEREAFDEMTATLRADILNK